MKRTLLPLFCLLLLPAHLYSAELANGGATAWKIVLPDEPTMVEKTAARELSEHLKLVTGANFPTLAERDVPAEGKSLIFVGHTARAPKKDYKFDEILIKMDRGSLILAGHQKRGCLYAVYSFLQDVVGVRWWTAEATLLPKKPTLVVADDLNVSYAPQMISREMYHRDAQPTVFSARMKGNGSLTPQYGGAVRIINFVHSFYKYLPPEKYFAAHPDWYSEHDGKRGARARAALPDQRSNDAGADQERPGNAAEQSRREDDRRFAERLVRVLHLPEVQGDRRRGRKPRGDARFDAQPSGRGGGEGVSRRSGRIAGVSVYPQAAQNHQAARQRLDSSLHD